MLSIKVVTPQGVKFADSQASSITMPTEAGVITVFADHEKLLSNLLSGEIEVDGVDYERKLKIGKGVVEIAEDSEVNLLVDFVEETNI